MGTIARICKCLCYLKPRTHEHIKYYHLFAQILADLLHRDCSNKSYFIWLCIQGLKLPKLSTSEESEDGHVILAARCGSRGKVLARKREGAGSCPCSGGNDTVLPF